MSSCSCCMPCIVCSGWTDGTGETHPECRTPTVNSELTVDSPRSASCFSNEKREEILNALAFDVHAQDGWLSGAQNADLFVNREGAVEFDGCGSIDLRQMIGIVLSMIAGEQA